MEQQKKRKHYGLTVAVICFAVFFVGTYAQYQISPLAPQVMKKFSISGTQYALLFTLCMFPALILSIVSGMLCDRFGAKRTVAIALILSTLGIVGRVFVGSYGMMLCCMVVLGLGCMFLTATAAKILAPNFPPEKLGGMVGIVSAGSTWAMFIATGTTAWFPSITSAFLFSAVLGVIVLAAWLICIKPNAAAAGAPRSVPMLESLKVCFKSKYIWASGVTLLFLMVGQVVVASFLPQTLQLARGASAQASGYMTSVYMLGAIAGSTFGPQLAMHIRAKRIFLSSAILIAGMGVAFAWAIPSTVVMGIALFVTGFCISMFVPLLYAFPVSLPDIGPVYAGTAGGLSATIQMLGATVVPTYILTPLFGADFNKLFLSAGGVLLLAVITVNILPLYSKKG